MTKMAINKKERNRKEMMKNMKEIIKREGAKGNEWARKKKNERGEWENGEGEKRVREKEGKGE